MTLVIFGGAGDLTHRKLLPALYNLFVDGLLPEHVVVVGVGRKDFGDDGYRAFARDGVQHFSRRPIDEKHWTEFAKLLYFVNVDITAENAFATLGSRLDVIEHEQGRIPARGRRRPVARIAKARVEDRGAVLRGGRGDLRSEARLSDSRLADHEECGTFPATR